MSSKCKECSGLGRLCVAGCSAHPSNWYACESCNGTGAAPVVERQDVFGAIDAKVRKEVQGVYDAYATVNGSTVVERQPVAFVRVVGSPHTNGMHTMSTFSWVQRVPLPVGKYQLYTAPPELAELQATIARLTAENERNAKNAKEWEEASLHWMSERDQFKADIERLNDELSACTTTPGGCSYWRESARLLTQEIERLKGGQGEPVGFRYRTTNGPWEWMGESPYADGRIKHCDSSERLEPLYASQTAPVSVVLPERFDESQYRGTSLLAVRRWNACIDKVKELNQ